MMLFQWLINGAAGRMPGALFAQVVGGVPGWPVIVVAIVLLVLLSRGRCRGWGALATIGLVGLLAAGFVLSYALVGVRRPSYVSRDVGADTRFFGQTDEWRRWDFPPRSYDEAPQEWPARATRDEVRAVPEVRGVPDRQMFKRELHEQLQDEIADVRRAADEAADEARQVVDDVRKEMHAVAEEARNEIHRTANNDQPNVDEKNDRAAPVQETVEDRETVVEAAPPTVAPEAPAAEPASSATEAVAVKLEGPASANGPLVRDPSVRPDWVDASLGIDKRGPYRTKLSAGPYATREECDEELHELVRQRVQQYVGQRIAADAEHKMPVLSGYVWNNIVKEEWVEVDDESYTVGPMTTVHALLEFDNETNANLQTAWNDYLVQQRLLSVGGVVAVVMGVLATLFGYLKLDTLTRGYYTRRLQALAAVVILGLLAMLIS